MFPEGIAPLFNHRNKGLKCLDPTTTGKEIRMATIIPKHIRDTSDPVLDSYLIWTRILTSYMECSLTKEEDKLVAISAITKSIQSLVNHTYIAGLWIQNLPFHLLWKMWSTVPVQQNSGHGQSYIAPSWSWASASGLCTFFEFIDIHQKQYMIQILETMVVPKGPDPTGQILYASIKIRCWLKSFLYRHSSRGRDLELGLYQIDRVSAYFDKGPGSNGSKLFLMPILECPDDGVSSGSRAVFGLIISRSRRKGEFCRVGFFTANSNWSRKSFEFCKRPTFAEVKGKHSIIYDTPLENLIIGDSDDESSKEDKNTTDPIGGSWTEAVITLV